MCLVAIGCKEFFALSAPIKVTRDKSIEVRHQFIHAVASRSAANTSTLALNGNHDFASLFSFADVAKCLAGILERVAPIDGRHDLALRAEFGNCE